MSFPELRTALGDIAVHEQPLELEGAKLEASLSPDNISTATYKNLIGTTRKYAVPLMEFFDGEHLTMRAGEARVLRRKK